MLQCVNCRQSICRIHFHQLFEEMQSFRRQLSQISLLYGLEILNIGEFHSQKSWIFKKGLIMVRSQRAQALLNQKQLIQLVLPWKHRISVNQFTQNAAYCPYVNLFRVMSTNQKLRRTIPSCCHIVCQLLLCARTLQLPCKTKITNFQLIFITYEQILWFDIPMDYVQRVHVSKAFKQLIHKKTNELRLKPIRRFLQYLKQIVLYILKYKIHDALFAKSFLQRYCSGVLEHFKDFYFSHCGLFYNLIVFRLFKLFYSYDFFVLIASALQYDTVGSLTDQSQNIIFLHINFMTILQLTSDQQSFEINFLQNH